MSSPEKNLAASQIVLTTFDEEAVKRAAGACLEALGGRVDLVFAFVTPDFGPHLTEFIELVQVYGHAAQIVGCSGGGLIGTAEENEEVAGFSLLALRLPRTRIDVRTVTSEGRGFDVPDDPDVAAAEPPGIALFHPMRMDPQAWLAEWNMDFPATPVFGGLASGAWTDDGIFLFDEHGPVAAAGLLVRLRGGVRVEGLVSQGCRPIGAAQPITEASDNVVAKLGGRRAYEVLHDAVEGLMKEGAEIVPGSIHAGLAVSDYLEAYRRGDFLIRNLLGADSDSGLVQIGAPAEVGRTLQFQYRDSDAADEDLRAQCDQLRQNAGAAPIAGLLFSCGGRGRAFFEVPNHDAGLLAESIGPVPLAGFFCAGEIGPVGVASYVHGYTASAAMLYDGE